MATKIIMPVLGMSQETGTILRWLKKNGEPVEKGEVLLEVETDKAVAEIEAPASGVLAGICAQEGEEVPVAQEIAVLLAPGESLDDVSSSAARVDAAGSSGDSASQPGKTLPSAGKGGTSRNEVGDVLASPLAKRIARENELDLGDIPHAGRRIEKADVISFLEKRQTVVDSAPKGEERILASPKAKRLMKEKGIAIKDLIAQGWVGKVISAKTIEQMQPRKAPAVSRMAAKGTNVTATSIPLSKTWQIMAERTTNSWQSAPHFYLMREINASRLIAWRESLKRHSNVKITYTDLLVKAVAFSIEKHPRINAVWNDGQVIRYPQIHIGIAVATESGLVVPVIHDADSLDVEAIASRRIALIERARGSGLRPDDIRSCSFTITNLGMYGIDAFQAVLNGNQAGILAVGRIKENVVAIDGQAVVAPTMTMSLSCDHRVIDGAMGALFLQTLAEALEEPLTIFS